MLICPCAGKQTVVANRGNCWRLRITFFFSSHIGPHVPPLFCNIIKDRGGNFFYYISWYPICYNKYHLTNGLLTENSLDGDKKIKNYCRRYFHSFFLEDF